MLKTINTVVYTIFSTALCVGICHGYCCGYAWTNMYHTKQSRIQGDSVEITMYWKERLSEGTCQSYSLLRGCKNYKENHKRTDLLRRCLCAQYKCRWLNILSKVFNQPCWTGVLKVQSTPVDSTGGVGPE
jgi:hypothetical protein